MQVTCGDCGKRCSVPDAPEAPGDVARRYVCSMCGARLMMGAAEGGPEPRDEPDTLRLDASSLATLVRLGEATFAATAREGTESPRASQMSIPFELARERALPLAAPRAPQASIPFELVRQEPAQGTTPNPPPSSATPFAGRRESGAEDWEGTFVSRVRGSRKRWGLTLVMMAAAILIALGALIASGRIDPARLLD
jgi:hypothetical protein